MLRITSIETFCNEFVGFVRITDQTGLEGWGQVSTYHSDITCQVLHRQVAPWVLGAQISDLDDLLDLVTEREHKFPGSYLRRAIGGFDTAIWDLRGKQSQKPVVELLGGEPGKLRAYASSMKRDITPKEEAERLVRLQGEFGYDAFKVRAGSEVGRNEDEWSGRTEEIIPTMRKYLGQDASLLIDANSCYSPDRAIEVGRILEDNGFCHFEEPCPYWEPEETKKVTEALEIDVTGGEQDCDFRIWKDMIDRKIVNIFQPDVMYMGGLTRILKLANMINKSGFTCTPHAANLSLVTVCTMHFLKAIPNAGKYLEYSIEGEDYYPWQKNLFSKHPFNIIEGNVEISDDPGWGVEINKNWLETSDYKISE